MMIKGFFVNICILVTFFYLIGSFSRKLSQRGWIRCVGLGSIFGGMGLVLMLFSIPLSHHTIADLRHLAFVASATYFGSVATLTATAIISLGRIIMFGYNQQALNASVTMLAAGVVCILISKGVRSTWWRVHFMNYASLGLISVALSLNLGFSRMTEVFPYHIMTSLIGGVILFFIAEHFKKMNRYIKRLSNEVSMDHLTKLHNVKAFDEDVNRQINHSTEHGTSFALLLLDIDHFKHVNDTYGHLNGDEVLIQLASILRASSGKKVKAYRNGGEEFSMIMSFSHEREVYEKAEEIRTAVESQGFHLKHDQQIHITISIGYAIYQPSQEVSIFENADEALYRAKRSGRNRVCGPEGEAK
ncbi:diguanylate cyclase [Rossellomorea aquimaris]|uniref:diguanylate cyclase n=1 Tax=Rossellomorea aquimaris TaxID=189382 RepID=UPI001CD80D37|nr:diguanylate cyclase [Rossellomorea aquimaris]MCA1053982.1 diguanylate cyclase [Rossellomorea aquimaris]